MISQSLRKFIDKALRSKRITYTDVVSLRRDILPDGLSARDEAEALIALDQAVAKADPAWAGYLVGIVVDYAVWGSRPTGRIDRETALWLARWLACETPSKALLRIGREVVSEAQDVHDVLRSFVEGSPAPASPRKARTPAAAHFGA
jgi:hypothetical protein